MRTSTFMTYIKVELQYTGIAVYHIAHIAARVGRDQMPVSRICNRWVKDGNKECHEGSEWHLILSTRKDKYFTCMDLMDHAATLGALSQELGSFAKQQVSA
ncbi:uncharacterized protein TNCV_3467891 [Trichonephila clavipes]|nr:uncharacterized protein TNCV_3467891 [Trichonephila clavipes]